MKENNNLPEEARIGALLRAARSSPGLPPRFQENVWRRIQDAEAPAKPASWLDAFVAFILRPRFALAAAAMLLLAGILSGTADGRHVAKHEAQMNYLASVAPAFVR